MPDTAGRTMILCMTEVSECRSNDAVFGKEGEGITGIRTSRWIELDTVCIHIDSKWSGGGHASAKPRHDRDPCGTVLGSTCVHPISPGTNFPACN